MTQMRRFACVLLALVAVGCGGGGDDGSGTAATGDTSGSDGTTTTLIDVAGDENLPTFLADFDRLCTTQVGFDGAAPYAAGPGPHPVALFESYREADNLLQTSRTLPAGWGVTEDADFEDNSELATIELVACLMRTSETPNGTQCEFDDDGEKISLELVDAQYELAIYEAVTGDEVQTSTLDAVSTECPFVVTFEKGDTQWFNEATDDDLVNALKPVVDP